MAKKTAPTTTAQPHAEVEYRVSYLDSEVGRVQVEEFDTLAAAEHFAAVQLRTEGCWAIVEQMEIHEDLRLVA